MRVSISGFRSIKGLELDLAPLAVLLGPPASGKSNILDALALTGYLGRIRLLKSEYEGQATLLEPLRQLARFREYRDLFRYYDLSREIEVALDFGDVTSVYMRLYFREGRLRVSLNGIEAPVQVVDPLDIRSHPQDAGIIETWVFRALRQALDVRVYGYDRYGLSINQCRDEVVCGFYYRVEGMHTKSAPLVVLSELAWNVSRVIKSVPKVVPELNDHMREFLGERVELKVLRDGKIAVFDYDFEVEASTLSDSILRTLYYTVALISSINYAKLRGLEGRLIVALEEPESHVFPFLMELIVEYLAKAVNTITIVVTTHNPIFASMIGDKVKDAKFYYVHRLADGSTSALEIDLDSLAKELEGLEDLLLMEPREVREKYAVARG